MLQFIRANTEASHPADQDARKINSGTFSALTKHSVGASLVANLVPTSRKTKFLKTSPPYQQTGCKARLEIDGADSALLTERGTPVQSHIKSSPGGKLFGPLFKVQLNYPTLPAANSADDRPSAPGNTLAIEALEMELDNCEDPQESSCTDSSDEGKYTSTFKITREPLDTALPKQIKPSISKKHMTGDLSLATQSLRPIVARTISEGPSKLTNFRNLGSRFEPGDSSSYLSDNM